MHALIDGDIVVFRCAVVHENDPLEIAVVEANDMIYRILQAVDAQSYTIWLSGGQNERKRIDPQYKANRDDKVDPIHRENVKAALITDWNAKLTDGIEADDALGIEQCRYEFGTSTICSIDKDLKQVRGLHYNFVKDEYETVSALDGLRLFYRQFLTGDRADNVVGVRGLGDVKSKRLINHLEDEMDMFTTVQNIYSDDERLLTNGKLLWIHKKEDDWWNFPSGS